MSVKVNTTDDLSYDYEDFCLDVDDLQAKYISGEHPAYTIAKWRVIADTEADVYNGYWDYVLAMISKDDEHY